METFKEFLFKNLLQESPKLTGSFDPPYSYIKIAQEIFADIKNNPNKYKKVFTIFEKNKVDLIQLKEDNDVTLYFVPTNEDDFIYGYATYEILADGGIEMISVYNRSLYHGLAQYVYIKYLIPSYKYILSNGHHSKSGKNFWRNLVMLEISENSEISIWDDFKKKTVKIIKNVNELEDFYDTDTDFKRFRIKIAKLGNLS